MALYREGAKTCSPACRKRVSRMAKAPKLPAEMTNKPRWIRWKLANRKGRTTKVPLTISGKAGSSTDAGTWSTFTEASGATVGDGVGFVLGQGIGCIDLDHCFVDGELAGWAQSIVDRCPPTFMEISQSGGGLHVFGLFPEAPGRNIRRGEANVEFYSVGRYIAVTGDRFADSHAKLADLSGLVASLS